MDISIFGEVNDNIDEKLTEIGVKYVYKYYPAKEEFEKNPTKINELLEFTYGKMIDLIKILTNDKMQIQKIRAYRQEIQAINKYVDYDLSEVYEDLKIVQELLS
jgi:3-polyprenyl-4-hydroxybenzoate decarboxylase